MPARSAMRHQKRDAPPEALIYVGHGAVQRSTNGHQQGAAGKAGRTDAVHAPVAVESVKLAQTLARLQCLQKRGRSAGPLALGLRKAGRNVIDLGMVPTPHRSAGKHSSPPAT